MDMGAIIIARRARSTHTMDVSPQSYQKSDITLTS